jgi:hypothetical protein
LDPPRPAPPPQAPSTRLADPAAIEVGLGIHGEPGLRQAAWQPAALLVKDMLARVVPRLPPPPLLPGGKDAAALRPVTAHSPSPPRRAAASLLLSLSVSRFFSSFFLSIAFSN